MAKTEVTYRGPVWVLVLVGGLLVAIAVAGGLAVTGTVGSPADPTVTLLPAAAQGPDPFTDSAGNGSAVTIPSAAGTASASLRKDLPSERNSHLLVASGTAPGLYGGSGDTHVCDPEALVAFLAAHPVKAAAWARVLGVAPRGIAAYVATLTPAVLTSDTLVGNHGYHNGAATDYASVLQAGTAVMVDPTGTPRVKCNCGNPLTPPQPIELSRAKLVGTAWPGYTPRTVVLVRPGPKTTQLVLADLGLGPVRSDSSHDGTYQLTQSVPDPDCARVLALDGVRLVLHGTTATITDRAGIVLTGSLSWDGDYFVIKAITKSGAHRRIVLTGSVGPPGVLSGEDLYTGDGTPDHPGFSCEATLSGTLTTGSPTSRSLGDGSYRITQAANPECGPGNTSLDQWTLTLQGDTASLTNRDGLVFAGTVTRHGTRFEVKTRTANGAKIAIDLTGTAITASTIRGTDSYGGANPSGETGFACGGPFTAELIGTATTGPVRSVTDLPAGLRCADLQSEGFSYRDAVAYWRAHQHPSLMDADGNGIPCETVYPASAVNAVWGTRAPTPICTSARILPVVIAIEGDPRLVLDRLTCDGPWALVSVEVHESPEVLDAINVILHYTAGAWHRAPNDVCAPPRHIPAAIYTACLVN